ncbi:hypothetical protein [Streptomyces cinereoruber]|uniref:hypothetical protein n=1 Tax=Streptomyces cinereoruber TaxID=67260 RepID=UPI003643D870
MNTRNVADEAVIRGGVADGVREAFAAASGLEPSWFSFNSKGACPACRGGKAR